MVKKPMIKIGHLKISDHLILGATKSSIEENLTHFNYLTLETICMTSWNQIADSLVDGSIDGAFILAPLAMDLFKMGVELKLLLFTHKDGSILVTNKAAQIETLDDFKGKVVLIPYQLSVHHILFHRILSQIGLRPGNASDPDVDVLLEVMAPTMMPEAIQYDEEGEIAGFIVAEPIGSQTIAEGFGKEFCLSKDLWQNHPCCVWVMNNNVVEKYPDAIQELTNSFVQSGIEIENNPEKAAIMGAKFLEQDISVITNILSGSFKRISTDKLYPIIGDLIAIQEYLVNDMALMKDKIDLNQLVDSNFAKKAGAK